MYGGFSSGGSLATWIKLIYLPLATPEEAIRRVKQRLPVSRLDDPDMRAAPAAMERAVRRAHRVAHQHGTGVLVVENGEMVEIEPDPAMWADE